jgi:hypothetical protein
LPLFSGKMFRCVYMLPVMGHRIATIKRQVPGIIIMTIAPIVSRRRISLASCRLGSLSLHVYLSWALLLRSAQTLILCPFRSALRRDRVRRRP